MTVKEGALGARRGRRHRGLSRRARREEVEFYLFISPWILGLIAFMLGPLVASFGLSFMRYDGYNPPSWVGLEQYRTLIEDPLFWNALWVTFKYALLAVPLQIVLGLAIALILNEDIHGLAFWRTVYFTPSVVSGVAVAVLWGWVFNPEFGVINWALRTLFGIQGPLWLHSRQWAVPALVIMSLWGVGGTMVIYLAGLQGIPTQLYEAATIDGAGPFRQLINITLPMLTPVIFFMLIMGIIGSLQIFTPAYILTGGGPGNATLFYVFYLFRQGFLNSNMGYAAALSWVFFVIILALTLLVFRSSALWVYYEGEIRG